MKKKAETKKKRKPSIEERISNLEEAMAVLCEREVRTRRAEMGMNETYNIYAIPLNTASGLVTKKVKR